MYSSADKSAWFNHLIAQLALGNASVPKGVTMRKVREFIGEIFSNYPLWHDLLSRHLVLASPEKTMEERPDIYERAVSNFWAGVWMIIMKGIENEKN